MIAPVLVTGVGRTGTSAVARVLHEQLGVCMGPDDEELREPTKANPRGDYEDRAFRQLHIQVTNGRVERETFERRAMDLLGRRSEAHTPSFEVYSAWLDETVRGPLPGDPWGFKDPRACHVLDFYLGRGMPLKLVVCERDFDDVLDSWGRVCAGRRRDHRREIHARSEALERATEEHDADPLRLDMTEHRSDAWIRERLEPVLHTEDAEP